MKYQALCEAIIQHIGGKENVLGVTHCVTRLRFKLRDASKADTKAVGAIDGVMKVIETGGQYQVVIGPNVDRVYEELCQLGGFTSAEPVAQMEAERREDGGKKQNILSRFLILMTGIFQPVLSILMASGMIKALLTVFTLAGWMSATDNTYIILSAIGDTIFYFFPVALGWTAAKKFGLKEIYGIVLGGVLCYPTIGAFAAGEPLFTAFAGTLFESTVYTTFLGIPVIFPSAGYTGSVIPIILITFVASKLYKFLNKYLPSVIRSFFVPFITLLVTVPLALIVIGPIAMFLQGLITGLVQVLIGLNGGIAGFLLGTFWSVLVMFGLHMAVIPMFALNVATYGYDIINPLIFSGALASMGAVLGVLLRTKSAKERNICVPAMISSFFGVNEPTLYGVLIPRRKVMISCFVSAGVGSAIAGFCGAKLYAFGASGPLGLPCFINPNGIDIGFIGLVAGAIISFVLAAVCAYVIGDKKDDNAIEVNNAE